MSRNVIVSMSVALVFTVTGFNTEISASTVSIDSADESHPASNAAGATVVKNKLDAGARTENLQQRAVEVPSETVAKRKKSKDVTVKQLIKGKGLWALTGSYWKDSGLTDSDLMMVAYIFFFEASDPDYMNGKPNFLGTGDSDSGADPDPTGGTWHLKGQSLTLNFCKEFVFPAECVPGGRRVTLELAGLKGKTLYAMVGGKKKAILKRAR